MERANVTVWVDGGWGIDALLGAQTRAHDDLDLALSRRAFETALQMLAAEGFALDDQAQPGPPARIVLRDESGRQIDLHPLSFDQRGNGWQKLGGDAWGLYSAEGLTGAGSIEGRPVRCLTPELQLRHHLGWSWTEKDRADLSRLAERYDLSLPPA